MDKMYSDRRRFLGAATALVASAGAITASVPLIKSWQPSARTRVAGAPVEVIVDKLAPGQMITVKWRGKPVWILRRSQSILINLGDSRHLEKLRDPDSSIENQPDYARNQYRSLRPEIFVAIGICTHLGCVPIYQATGDEIDGGSVYFCPCHGSRFDLAGRVFKNVPAPTNLVIPPHRYSVDDTLVIGENPVNLG